MGFSNYYRTECNRLDGDHFVTDLELTERIKTELSELPNEERSTLLDDTDIDELFDQADCRIYYDDFCEIMRKISRRYPEVLFEITHEAPDSGPGLFYYYFLNGGFQDATPPLCPEPLDIEAIDEDREKWENPVEIQPES